MLKWLKMGGGHLVALPLIVVGGYAGVFSMTILLDVLVRTAGRQTEGLVIGTTILMGAAAGVGGGGWLLYYLWGTIWPSEGTPLRELAGREAPVSNPSLHQLREGDHVDYNLRTWTVADHTEYPYQGWPTDVWILEHNGEKRILEYYGASRGTFRLYEPARLKDVKSDGVGVLGTENKGEAPATIEYEETGYTLAEDDVRADDEVRLRTDDADRNPLVRSQTDRRLLGVCGGIAQYLEMSSLLIRFGLVAGIFGMSIVMGSLIGFETGCYTILFLIVGYAGLALVFSRPPTESLSHYWVYESVDGDLLALQCKEGTWTARYGREVEPYEFDNVLPAGKAERGGTTSR